MSHERAQSTQRSAQKREKVRAGNMGREPTPSPGKVGFVRMGESVIVCRWCELRVPIKSEKDHVFSCVKHPMRVVERQLDALLDMVESHSISHDSGGQLTTLVGRIKSGQIV